MELKQSLWAERSQSSFGRALTIALIVEALSLVGWFTYAYFAPPVHVGLKRSPMVVHMVTLPRPLVKPKPIVKHIPRPVRHVVHHPVPLPRPAPPKPVIRPRPVPPKPQPVVQPRPVPVALAAQAVDQYAVMLRTRIQTGLHVPGEVRALGLSGAAVITFKLTPSGQLLWARVGHSSGMGPIDRACLAAVRARVYPPFTRHMPKHPMVFNVTVSMRRAPN